MRRHLLTLALLAGAVPLVAGSLTANEPGKQPAPAIGSYGFDVGGMDRSVAPGDNFYDYANAAWARNTQIPADKSNYGMFTALQDLSQTRVRGLLDAAQADPASKIGAAYASFLDEKTVEAKGLAPITPWLNEVRALKDHAGYAALAAKAARNGVGSLFFGFVAQDDKAPDRYIFQMGSAGLGLPDRDFYLLDDARMKGIRKAYVAHIAKTLTLAGEGNAEARAEALLAFETEVAKVSWTREDNGDATKTYNKMSVAGLSKLAPGFDFAGYIRARGAKGVSELLVAQPSAFTAIAALGAKADISVLKDQVLVGSLDNYSDVLPKAVTDELLYSTTLNGTPENQPRWKRAVDFTTNSLTDDVSKVYVAKYFPPESKAAMETLVGNVLNALGKRIDGLGWMQPETKIKAKAKLAAFKTRIGYPDQWHDYGSIRIDRADLFGNQLRANNWGHDWNLQKLGKPIYRWEWGLDPMTVNAQANFQLVAITFPAAILQPPFFDPHADAAINYGGIGAVIGHEISHHFDDQGAKYDASGKLSDWWTEKDVAAFKALSQNLVKQYDAYEIFPGEHVKGEFTLGENIGDLAGLNIAYDAYKASVGGDTGPTIDGTTGDQRFFLGWAQVWRRNYREANLRSRLLTDPHAPSVQRVAVIRNLDAWYSAYQPLAGQKLFLKPEERVRIW